MPAKKTNKDSSDRWQRTFPPAKRGDYLALQHELEQTAPQICFLTPSLSNAITTEAHLNEVIIRGLTSGLKELLPTARWEPVRNEVFEWMRRRREQLESRLAARDVHIRVLFLKSELVRDLRRGGAVALARYQLLLKLIEDGVVTTRLIRNSRADALEAAGGSFALIYNTRKGAAAADVAMASAAQATSPRLVGQQRVAQNTPEVFERIALFERYWNAALGEAESRTLIQAAVGGGGHPRQ